MVWTQHYNNPELLEYSWQYYIYIYAFSRRFYPKRLTVHSGYTYFVSVYYIHFNLFNILDIKYLHLKVAF